MAAVPEASALASTAAATGDHFYGQIEGGAFLEIEWDKTWSGVSANANGSTGWARVLRSSGSGVSEGACRRVHKCSHNPCKAKWSASKYGLLPPPIHVQEVEPAVAVFGPAPPTSAPLRLGFAPPPATFDPQLREKTALGADAADPGHKVLGQILKLAREIRTPYTYVGYSFFVLLGMARKCQPHMWEGESRMNMLALFAPWSLQSAVADCAVDGVVSCMKALPSGRVQMIHVSEEHPLAECRHFIACHTLDNPLPCEGDEIESFYGRLGVVLLGTVMDGDCGIDTACMMLSLPQTKAVRDALRREIADYLVDRCECRWMHQLLVVCAELHIEDVELLHQSGGRQLLIDLSHEPAVAEGAVASDPAVAAGAVANSTANAELSVENCKPTGVEGTVPSTMLVRR